MKHTRSVWLAGGMLLALMLSGKFFPAQALIPEEARTTLHDASLTSNSSTAHKDTPTQKAIEQYLSGVDLQNEQRYAEAAQAYERALLQDPNFSKARQALEKVQRLVKRQTWVGTAPSTTLQAMVLAAQTRYRQGCELELQNDEPAAMAAYQEALRIIPGYPEARAALARLEKTGTAPAGALFRGNNRTEAPAPGLRQPATHSTPLMLKTLPAPKRPPADQAAFRKVIQSHYLAGCQALDHGVYGVAVREFELVIEFVPDHREALFKLNAARRKVAQEIKSAETQAKNAKASGDTLEEISAVREIVALDPNHAQAQAAWRQARENSEKIIEEIYRRGVNAYAEGRYHEALRAWDLVLDLNPQHDKARGSMQKVREKLELLQ